jgi:hypothetical protein
MDRQIVPGQSRLQAGFVVEALGDVHTKGGAHAALMARSALNARGIRS